MFVDLPLRVTIAARRPVTESFEVCYETRVMCSREWYFDFGRRDALTLDPRDEYAATGLGRKDLPAVDFDKFLAELATWLENRYVILYNYAALGETLRLELPQYTFCDIATNVLIRNEALRRGGHFWPRTRSVAAPLAELWPAFFDHALDPLNTASVAKGLGEMFVRVEGQFRQRQRVPATPVAPQCEWRSTLTTRRPLIAMLDAERRYGRPRTRCDYSFYDAMPRIPRFRCDVRLHVMIVTGGRCDPMVTETVNCLTREAVIAGIGLLAFLQAKGYVAAATTSEIREEFETRRKWNIDSAWARRVSLEQFARDGAKELDRVLHEFLNRSDAEIRRDARCIDFSGLWLEKGPEFLCVELFNYWS